MDERLKCSLLEEGMHNKHCNFEDMLESETLVGKKKLWWLKMVKAIKKCHHMSNGQAHYPLKGLSNYARQIKTCTQ